MWARGRITFRLALGTKQGTPWAWGQTSWLSMKYTVSVCVSVCACFCVLMRDALTVDLYSTQVYLVHIHTRQPITSLMKTQNSDFCFPSTDCCTSHSSCNVYVLFTDSGHTSHQGILWQATFDTLPAACCSLICMFPCWICTPRVRSVAPICWQERQCILTFTLRIRTQPHLLY